MNYLRKTILLVVFFVVASAMQAQQVKTMYWLENAPMRHLMNPALQPASNFYLALPAIGYTSLWAGNNAMSLSDIADINLQPYPDGVLWDKMPYYLKADVDAYVNVLSIGFRFNSKGYGTLNIAERASVGGVVPKAAVGMLMKKGETEFDWKDLRASASLFTDISLGYSHKINHQWSVGGKVKLLLGHAYAQLFVDKMQFTSSPDMASLNMGGSQYATSVITDIVSGNGLSYPSTKDMLRSWIPGAGVAMDLGVTYKPIEHLELSASINDLGFIKWKDGAYSSFSADKVYTGWDNTDYEEDLYGYEGIIMTDLWDMMGDAVQVTEPKNTTVLRMLNANIHLGVNGKFWEDRVGLGVHFNTKFLEQYINEEITVGAFFCPLNWFNLAASYSLINGRWSNIGAALGLAPYDGLMFTLSADYVPLKYAQESDSGLNLMLPYKTQGFNLAFGVAIVAGTNKKK